MRKRIFLNKFQKRTEEHQVILKYTVHPMIIIQLPDLLLQAGAYGRPVTECILQFMAYMHAFCFRLYSIYVHMKGSVNLNILSSQVQLKAKTLNWPKDLNVSNLKVPSYTVQTLDNLRLKCFHAYLLLEEEF